MYLSPRYFWMFLILAGDSHTTSFFFSHNGKYYLFFKNFLNKFNFLRIKLIYRIKLIDRIKLIYRIKLIDRIKLINRIKLIDKIKLIINNYYFNY